MKEGESTLFCILFVESQQPGEFRYLDVGSDQLPETVLEQFCEAPSGINIISLFFKATGYKALGRV